MVWNDKNKNEISVKSDENLPIIKIPIYTIPNMNFEFTEQNNINKEVWLIYAEKGEGKTVLAMTIGQRNKGIISCISFDNKTQFTKKYFFENNNNIKVYDGLKYINDNPNEKLDSALINYNYLLNLFDFIKKNDKPDYILIDGSEKMTNIAEYCMRKNNSIKLYGGIANLNLWKERT